MITTKMEKLILMMRTAIREKTYNGGVGISYYTCNEICDDGVDNNLNGPGENKANK